MWTSLVMKIKTTYWWNQNRNSPFNLLTKSDSGCWIAQLQNDVACWETCRSNPRWGQTDIVSQRASLVPEAIAPSVFTLGKMNCITLAYWGHNMGLVCVFERGRDTQFEHIHNKNTCKKISTDSSYSRLIKPVTCKCCFQLPHYYKAIFVGKSSVQRKIGQQQAKSLNKEWGCGY